MRSGAKPLVRVQILHVPDCALLEHARLAVEPALTATDIRASVEEMEGEYSSPTVLINGTDVAGRTAWLGAACRLDLPTDTQLRAALTKAAASEEESR